ncbi:hypothetical protein, partial [Helicobacter sp.]|uniref:hypothetical protein n=1 Tax=Helicobacter sp. TaxID=218 RepID=UPI002A75114C
LTFLGTGGNHWGFSYAQNNGQGLVKSFDISEHKITHMICGYLNYFGFTKDRTKMLVMGYNNSGMLGVGHANAVASPTMLSPFRAPIKKFQGCFYCTAVLLENGELYVSGYTSGTNIFRMLTENVEDFILYYNGSYYGFFIRKKDGRLLSCLGNNLLTLNPVENGISLFPKLTSDYKEDIAGDKFVKMFGGFYDVVFQLKDNKAIICNTDKPSNNAYLFSFDSPIKKKIRHLCLLENGKLHSLNANADTFSTLRSDVVDFTLCNTSEQRGQQNVIVLTRSGEVFIWGNPRVLSGNNQSNLSNYKVASDVIEIAGHLNTNNAYVLKKDNGIYTGWPTFNILDRVL